MGLFGNSCYYKTLFTITKTEITANYGIITNMAALNFPDSPTINDEFTVDGRTWKWTGVFWEFVGSGLTQDDLDAKLDLSGGTMTGVLTLFGEPTSNQHATSKAYVDSSLDNVRNNLEQADADILVDITTMHISFTDSINTIEESISTVEGDISSINNSIDTIQDSVVTLNSSTETLSLQVQTVSTEVTVIQADLESLTTDVSDVSTEVTDLEADVLALTDTVGLKSPADSPTFTGSVVLPVTTSIGTVTSSEISHLSGLTSSIQDQIDDKLDSGVAAGIYAPLNDPTFGGTVTLPSTTSIGDISSTELGYLNGVTSSIQTQLTDLDTTKADLESPTFTGTVSGITSSMVGLGSVDNTSDLNKPVSTAQQTALDAKLSLSGGTMTGKITLDGDPTQALHAVTKQYVDSVEGGLLTRPQVRAATTSNLAADYSNGTLGVGATLTSTSNGAFPLIDDVVLTTVNGARGILVKSQTNAAHNGRYNLTTQGDSETPWVLTRCGLCDEADEIPGSYIFVTDGTLNGQTGWVQHVDDPATFTVGTDDIDVYQFAGAGSALTAGTNISVSGSQVSVIDAPIFSGIVDASASGVEFSDGVQTKAGVPTLTTFVEKTASYTLDTLVHQDNIIEMNSTSPMTFTIPTNAALAWPVGASMDILQTNTGEVTIAASGGVTLNRTPGNKLRTQWSSATILKRGTDSWILYGDLKA